MASPESSSAPARHIPDEFVEDIFARMPARSVLRCRCLSRAWAAALSTDAFVDHHLRLANRRGGPKLCIPPRSASADAINAWSPEAETTTAPLMAVPHGTRNGRIIPYGRPYRGLLLLRAIFARLYFVCNPSAGEVALTASRPPIPADVGVPPVHVGGKMHWMGEQRRLGILVFDTMPAPPALPDDAGGAVLAALAGKLCVAHSCRETETMSIWAKSAGDEGEWETLHVIDLARWPAFSPRAAELVVPMAVDCRDGRVLLDAGKALGYYDARSTTLETKRVAKIYLYRRMGMEMRDQGSAARSRAASARHRRSRTQCLAPARHIHATGAVRGIDRSRIAVLRDRRFRGMVVRDRDGST
uniref:F-box domain-containing protein n=1 Tax=Oryza meridionalis TaxID=40149 RepID=A0A0E0FE94_9ORYZ